jgi:hypothetical protein
MYTEGLREDPKDARGGRLLARSVICLIATWRRGSIDVEREIE